MITTQDLITKFRQALEEKWGYIWGTAGVQWTAAKQKELEQTTDPDREQGRRYGKKWIGHRVADCSGLFSWAFRQLGGTMYHGSNTMYLKWCADKGSLQSALHQYAVHTLVGRERLYHWAQTIDNIRCFCHL